jgi:hypothetical protein
MGAVSRDREAGLDEGERAEVGLQCSAALLEGGGVREGGGLDRRSAEVADCVEVVGGGSRVALRVGGGDVVAERAVEVDFFSWIATMTFATIGTGCGGRAA